MAEREKDPGSRDPRRLDEALRSRYLGTAVAGLLILAYIALRLLLAG